MGQLVTVNIQIRWRLLVPDLKFGIRDLVVDCLTTFRYGGAPVIFNFIRELEYLLQYQVFLAYIALAL